MSKIESKNEKIDQSAINDVLHNLDKSIKVEEKLVDTDEHQHGLYTPLPAGCTPGSLLRKKWPVKNQRPFAIVGYLKTESESDGMAIFNSFSTLEEAKQEIVTARKKHGWKWCNIHILYTNSGWFAVPPTRDSKKILDVMTEHVNSIKRDENDVLGQVKGAKLKDDDYYCQVVDATKVVFEHHLGDLLHSFMNKFIEKETTTQATDQAIQKFVNTFTHKDNVTEMLDKFDPNKQRHLLFQIIGVGNQYARIKNHRIQEEKQLERWRKEAQASISRMAPKTQAEAAKMLKAEMIKRRDELQAKKEQNEVNRFVAAEKAKSEENATIFNPWKNAEVNSSLSENLEI